MPLAPVTHDQVRPNKDHGQVTTDHGRTCTFSLVPLYTICALLQISLMQLCRLASRFWTDALVPYGENIFSGIFFRRSGIAMVRRQNGVFLTIAFSPLSPSQVAGASHFRPANRRWVGPDEGRLRRQANKDLRQKNGRRWGRPNLTMWSRRADQANPAD
jgi:hypothetical protein